jgi:drug/metabolite transporter (DMT)-like permease
MSSHSMNRRSLILSAAVLSNVLWGTTFLSSKILLQELSPISVTVFRFLIAIAFMLFWGVAKRNDFQIKVASALLPRLLILSLVGFTSLYAFQMYGLRTINSSTSAVIMLLAPLFAIVAQSFAEWRIRAREISLALVGFLGAAIVLLDRQGQAIHLSATLGTLLTLMASVSLGVSVVMTRAILNFEVFGVKMSVFNLTFYTLVFGTVGILPIFGAEIVLGSKVAWPSTTAWFHLFYLGSFCSVGAFLLWNWAVKFLKPQSSGLIMYIKTPIAIALGSLILLENVTALFAIGTFLIFFAILSEQFLWKRV